MQYFKVRGISKKINVYVLPLGGEPCDLCALSISIHLAIMASKVFLKTELFLINVFCKIIHVRLPCDYTLCRIGVISKQDPNSKIILGNTLFKLPTF